MNCVIYLARQFPWCGWSAFELGMVPDGVQD
jgi:hypothetical protein